MVTRRHVSTKRRAALFLAKGGICHLCGGRIAPGEGWDLSHVIPLELGSPDDTSNWDVAHRTCHRAHTAAEDVPAIAKAKRRLTKHIGAHRSASPLPCGKQSPWKRKLTGELVRRHP